MITQGMHKKKENNTFFSVLDDQKIMLALKFVAEKLKNHV